MGVKILIFIIILFVIIFVSATYMGLIVDLFKRFLLIDNSVEDDEEDNDL